VPLDRKETAQLKQLGANVRRQRIARELSQERLAELVELHPRSVQKIERGETNILITTVLRFKRALGCAWDELMPKE
jgi:transcriptional regulator with XRE-family HTH domain